MMMVSVDVTLVLDGDAPCTVTTAAITAVAEVVDIDDLTLEVHTVKPLTEIGRALLDGVRTGDGRADVTVLLSGSLYDVQELVRRWEE